MDILDKINRYLNESDTLLEFRVEGDDAWKESQIKSRGLKHAAWKYYTDRSGQYWEWIQRPGKGGEFVKANQDRAKSKHEKHDKAHKDRKVWNSKNDQQKDDYLSGKTRHLNENDDIKSSMIKAHGLEHIRFNLYKNKSGQVFKWDEYTNKFEKTGHAHLGVHTEKDADNISGNDQKWHVYKHEATQKHHHYDSDNDEFYPISKNLHDQMHGDKSNFRKGRDHVDKKHAEAKEAVHRYIDSEQRKKKA